MKYIRTKDGIYELVWNVVKENDKQFITMKYDGIEYREEIIKQADTIEELCDEKVAIRKSNHKAYLGHFDGTYFFQEDTGWLGRVDSYEIIYGAIWTDKGLIYVAKMNEKGELELL